MIELRENTSHWGIFIKTWFKLWAIGATQCLKSRLNTQPILGQSLDLLSINLEAGRDPCHMPTKPPNRLNGPTSRSVRLTGQSFGAREWRWRSPALSRPLLVLETLRRGGKTLEVLAAAASLSTWSHTWVSIWGRCSRWWRSWCTSRENGIRGSLKGLSQIAAKWCQARYKTDGQERCNHAIIQRDRSGLV